MQRTIKALRIALPVAFVVFIAIIALNWNSRNARQAKAPGVGVTSTQRPDDKAIAKADVFSDTQTVGGRVVSKISARRVIAFASGWNTLEDVSMTIFRANGLTYELVCPEAQYNSQTKAADAKGGVKVTSSDGVMISTAELKFDGNRLTNDIPVDFKIDRWTGRGGALDLDVQGETLQLLKGVTATMNPATAVEPPMTLKGNDALFRRRENDVTFNQNVAMTRGADSLNAARVAGRFTQDRRTLIGLEGNGSVVIVMSGTPGPGEDLGGRKTIHCDRFFSEVGGDGMLSAIHAVGEAAPATALIDGPPRRDIVAREFRVGLQNRAVSDLKANNAVTMKETGEVVRNVSGDAVTVVFDPAQHRAVAAAIEGNFRYSDPTTQATAMRANYDILNDRVLLTADYGFDPTVVSDGNTLKAKQIEFAPKAQTAKATGEVIAQMSSKKSASADPSTLFAAGRPVFVNSDSVLMRQANKVAIFTGNVRAWQSENTLLAQEMQMQGSTQAVTARGNVRTALYNSEPQVNVKRVPVTSRSEQLVARRNERRIDLSGNVLINDEARSMSSENATFFFDANRKIEKIEAENKVTVKEIPTQRTGTGDKATYLLQKKLIYFSGTPATATAPNGSLKGQQIVFDLARNRMQVVSASDVTQGTYTQTP